MRRVERPRNRVVSVAMYLLTILGFVAVYPYLGLGGLVIVRLRNPSVPDSHSLIRRLGS